jgi:hypothetical protein
VISVKNAASNRLWLIRFDFRCKKRLNKCLSSLCSLVQSYLMFPSQNRTVREIQ